jgi:hypothetical protein
MPSDWIWEVPWSIIKPDPQTIINNHVAKYTGKVLFEFVAEKAWPIGCLAVATGAITTGALWWTFWRAEKNRSWILQVLTATMTSGALGLEYAATLHLGERASLTDNIKISLHQMVVWKAIANDAAAANVEKHIHMLFKEVIALNGPKIPVLANRSVAGFFIATIMYLWAKKMNNHNYEAKNDKIFYLMAGNMLLAFLFANLVRKEVVLKTMLVM